MTRALRVAVIGGGIGGLAAARALLMHGMEVTVFEQAPRLSEFGGGVVLTPNALTALRALGLEARVLANAFESRSQVVRSWRSGRVILRNSFASYRSHFGATSCSIHRGDMQKLLSEFVPERSLRLAARCRRWLTRDRSPALFRDLQSDYVDHPVPGPHGFGRCGRETVTNQLRQHIDLELVHHHHHAFGAPTRTLGKQFERAALLGIHGRVPLTGGGESHQAMAPRKRTKPKSATADFRPIVARLPICR